MNIKFIFIIFILLFSTQSTADSAKLTITEPPQIQEGLYELHVKAENGDSQAQNELGVRYLMNNGIAAHIEEGLKLLKKSAGKGNVDAYTNLGYLYREGIGVKSNSATAVHWFTKAAKAGGAKCSN